MTGALDLFSAATPSPAPNQRRWQAGDQVLHQRDPKQKEMLLVVLGYHSKTHVQCRFVYAGYAGSKLARKNPHALAAVQIIAVHHLLDPRPFGIKVTNAEDALFPNFKELPREH